MQDLGDVALILSGGGARGLRQCGMVKAVHDAGIRPNRILGTSVGALNAITYLQGGVEGIENLWMTIHTKDVYQIPWTLPIDPWTPKACFYDSSPLESFIRKSLDFDALRANPMPFKINTTDISNAKGYSLDFKELVNKEEAVQFAKASASPPLAFPPVKFRDKLLVDGGLVNNYSITEAVRDGADTLIVLSPSSEVKEDVHNAKDMLDRVLYTCMQGYLDDELKEVQFRNHLEGFRPIKVILVKPSLSSDLGFLDFDFNGIDREQIIRQGYDMTMEVLKRELK